MKTKKRDLAIHPFQTTFIIKVKAADPAQPQKATNWSQRVPMPDTKVGTVPAVEVLKEVVQIPEVRNL